MEQYHGEPEIDIREVWRIFIQRKFLFLGCMLFALGIAIIYITIVTPIYQATAVIEILEQVRNPAQIEDVTQQDFQGGVNLKTIEKSFQTRSLLRQVVDREDLQDYHWTDANHTPEALNSDAITRIFEKQVEVEMIKGTRLISISVRHQNPIAAKILANGIVEEYNKVNYDMLKGRRAGALEKLDSELIESRQQLQKSQQTLQQIKSLKRTYATIQNQKADLAKLKEGYLANLQQSGPGESYDTLEFQLQALRTSFPSPAQEVDSNSRESRLDSEYEHVLSFEPEALILLEECKTVHSSILHRRTEIQRLFGVESTPVIIRDPAWTPETPIKPVKIRVLASSGILGCGLGVILVWLLHFIDTSLKSVD